MPVISTGRQERWRECLLPSERAKLTFVCNGEMKPSVITPDGLEVYAGFEAPTDDPTTAASAGGSLTANYTYAYRYVYASSKYPFVQNAQAMGGELWPRSNPSEYESETLSGGDRTITVTVTKSTRADVDKIVIYRTIGHATSADANAAAEAGQMFYRATIGNNGIAGTVDYIDTGGAGDLTDELLEVDNYTPDCGWWATFDGTRWWMIGSPVFEAPATLDATAVVALTGDMIFDGRDGQVAKFDGIATGGFDGNGSYYIAVTGLHEITLYSDADLTSTAAPAFTGTTTVRIQGRASVLYRSKPFNPFSWGLTETIINADGTTTIIPQSFALDCGGGAATAIGVAANGRILVIHFENPQRTVTLDLEFAEDSQFGDTLRIIDDTGSVTAHFTVFNGLIGTNSVLLGMDTYNGNILACDGYKQVIVSDVLGGYMLGLDRDDDASRFFHGAYDPQTELNCFWVRSLNTTERINTLIWNHSATGEWGVMPDSVSANATILDADTNERFLIGGTEEGHIGRLFNTEFYDNWMNGVAWRNNSVMQNFGISGGLYTFDIAGWGSGYAVQDVTAHVDNTSVTVTGTPTCAVGDTITAYSAVGGVVTTQTVKSISGSVVTVDDTWTDPLETPTFIVIDPSRVDGQWGMISNIAGTQQWMVKLEATTAAVEGLIGFKVLEYYERGTTTIKTNDGGTAEDAPWYTASGNPPVYFGNIPIFLRTYFDTDSPVEAKKVLEAWATIENVDYHDGSASTPPFVGRYYQEYDETSTAARTFSFTRDLRTPASASADSDVWFKKTDVPSTALRNWGFEFSEGGFDELKFYGYTLKVDETT